jgi:hypothetical protein
MKLSAKMIRTAVVLACVACSGVPTPVIGQDGCSDVVGCDATDCDFAGCDACSNESECAVSSCMSRVASQFGTCGLIQPSEKCFDDFISPMINFVFFEDPRNLTELRPIFLTHNIPDALGGGSVQLFAMQFRVALTERLSLIAVKDGVILDNTDGAVDTLLDDGMADVSAGLKYNLIRDVQRGTLASAGFTYEIPMGSDKALQSVGDGEFHFFGTAGQRLLDGNAHALSSVGYRLPVDTDVQATSIHWSNHVDVRLTDRAYLFTEVAWWHWTDEASSGLPLGVAGQDLFNLPTTGVKGNDLVTQNVGMRFKPRRNVETGVAYEFPLTEFKDVIEDRVMLDLIVRY